MVNYTCAFSQWESGKYFEWIIRKDICSRSLSVWNRWFPLYTIIWHGILISSFSWSNVSRAVHSYSLDANFYLFSSTADPMFAELECLSIDEIMRPDRSDGPNSHCCSCLLVWNSVKDYWQRLSEAVVYSITKLLIGMLLSIASPKSVRTQGRTFTLVIGRFWGLLRTEAGELCSGRTFHLNPYIIQNANFFVPWKSKVSSFKNLWDWAAGVVTEPFYQLPNVWTINQSKSLLGFRVVTSLDGVAARWFRRLSREFATLGDDWNSG